MRGRAGAGRNVLAAAVVIIVVGVGGLGLGARRAHAQQDQRAEQLFRKGQALMKQGQIAEACEKFDASQRIESNASTLLNLAACREKNGQLATAWALFLRAASEARKSSDQALVQIAISFSDKLEPRLPFLTVSVPDTSRVDGLQILLDGRELDPEEYNQGVPVDPGPHAVEGRAPGHEAWTTQVTLAEAERKSVEVPRFKTLAKLAPDVGVGTGGGAEPAGPRDGPGEPGRGMTTMRKAAIGAGAVGVVGLAAMTVFGAQARGTWNDAQAQMDDELRQDAERKATLATVGGAVAVAGIAAGVTLWIVGKPKAGGRAAAWAPMVSRDGVGLAVGGRF